MYEAIIILSMISTGVSVVQAERMVNAIEQHVGQNRQLFIDGGVAAGKAVRTLRFCGFDSRADRYRSFVAEKMSPFGEQGRLMVDTLDEVASHAPDVIKMKEAKFSCAEHAKKFDASFAKLTRT